MLLYGALLSPFVRKVALVAEEKGIALELVPISPHSDHAGFREASPFGRIPALRDGDYCLADSSAIVAYLDARFPAVPMLPAEPEARGKAVWFDEFADTILAGAGLKILFNRLVGPKLLKIGGDEAIALQGEAELVPILAWLETAVPQEGWLVGDAFSLADVAVASVFRSLEAVGNGPNQSTHPRLAAWYDRISERPAWAKIALAEKRR